MVQNCSGRTTCTWIVIIAVCLFFIGGCAGSGLKHKEGSSSQASVKAKKGPIPVYYDFGDILIPNELKLQNKSSFVYAASGRTVGVLSFKANVEVYSLIKFFETSMENNNWKLVSSFRSTRSLLLFRKKNVTCMINITELTFKTVVEIWVAPEMHVGDSG
ncbi:MAG: hypothetical protein H8D67_00630 [Deltaproteobacteria bacterium]|nr:hypothetical protein [Deltaproteobacteria bacterium]